jgi:hypothetical protein
MKFSYGTIANRDEILAHLAELRANKPDLTVLDVGAVDNPWSVDYQTATLDLKPNPNGSVLTFQGDINEYHGWNAAFEYVERKGKFDFSICAHTLEDIALPQMALELLPEVSKAGFISMPSHRCELTRDLEGPWRGYIHHRWLFMPRDGKLLLIPKVPFIEHQSYPSSCEHDKTELRIYWNEAIDFKLINDGYLGPNVQCVIDMYREVLS